MKKNLIVMAVAVLVIAGAYEIKVLRTKWSAGKEEPKKEESLKLKVATLDNVDDANLLFYLAEEEGFFKKRGLETEEVKASKDQFKLLMSGDADVALSGVSSYLAPYLNGANLKWVATELRPFGSFGVSRFPKSQAHKIKKVVITGFGSESHMMAIQAVKNLGLDYKKIEFIAGPRQSKSELLKRGDIDFAVVRGFPDPKEYPAGSSFYDLDELLKGMNFYKGAVASEESTKSKGRAMSAFVSGLKEAAEYARNNKSAVAELVKRRYKYTDENAGAFSDMFLKASEGVDVKPDIGLISNLAALVKTEAKPEQPDRDLSGFVDSSFAK